jgi:CopG family nickel-responsive transcriptional regulator
MKAATQKKNSAGEGGIQRISVSLPAEVFRQLDEMVAERGLENRSKAIAEMISHFALQRRETSEGNPVMAGMITLVYDEAKGTLVQRLFELERQYLDEVISSLHVQLERGHRMEVIIVQGPINVLREITDKILACNGVLSCKLSLTDIVIPQVHAATRRPAKNSKS